MTKFNSTSDEFKDSELWLTKQPRGTFSLLPHAVSRSDFLDSYEKNVWCYLSTHTAKFHPSEELIAKHTGIREKAIRNIIDRLIEKNVIEITNLPRKPGKKKKYKLVNCKFWRTQPVLSTLSPISEQLAKTGSRIQEAVDGTCPNQSSGPGIENQKEDNLIENQKITDIEVRKAGIADITFNFREEVVEILTKSEDIESVILHLSNLIKNYTSLNGDSSLDIKWVLNKLWYLNKKMRLNSYQVQDLELHLMAASLRGTAEYKNRIVAVD